MYWIWCRNNRLQSREPHIFRPGGRRKYRDDRLHGASRSVVLGAAEMQEKVEGGSATAVGVLVRAVALWGVGVVFSGRHKYLRNKRRAPCRCRRRTSGRSGNGSGKARQMGSNQTHPDRR